MNQEVKKAFKLSDDVIKAYDEMISTLKEVIDAKNIEIGYLQRAITRAEDRHGIIIRDDTGNRITKGE